MNESVVKYKQVSILANKVIGGNHEQSRTDFWEFYFSEEKGFKNHLKGYGGQA